MYYFACIFTIWLLTFIVIYFISAIHQLNVCLCKNSNKRANKIESHQITFDFQMGGKNVILICKMMMIVEERKKQRFTWTFSQKLNGVKRMSNNSYIFVYLNRARADKWRINKYVNGHNTLNYWPYTKSFSFSLFMYDKCMHYNHTRQTWLGKKWWCMRTCFHFLDFGSVKILVCARFWSRLSTFGVKL